ncbi:MAG: FUSC family protein [Solirubrobacterales bacterium]|nr:FUSC family protein [Solirubrobacterales bacterium]
MSHMSAAAWRLRGPATPALRRGALAALPVGAGLLLDLGLDTPAAGAVSTGALIAGFVALDAPARTRSQWQVMTAPVIGSFAAIGVISGHSATFAVLVMTVLATAAGFCVAVSPRLGTAGVMCVLALLIAQGLDVSMHEAVRALLLATAGGLLQAATSRVASVWERGREPGALGARARGARDASVRNLTLESHALRHALRWGVALGAAVAVYRFVDLQGHGYWVPLTVLFVLRPELDETVERVIMRAAGTLVGLSLATVFAEIFGYHVIPTAILLTVAAACAYTMVAVEYAVFTAAISVYVVLLADAVGEHAWHAADQRALATLIGSAIAGLALVLWPTPPESREPASIARSPE